MSATAILAVRQQLLAHGVVSKEHLQRSERNAGAFERLASSLWRASRRMVGLQEPAASNVRKLAKSSASDLARNAWPWAASVASKATTKSVMSLNSATLDELET